MKNTDSKTATKFVKHLVTKLDQEQQSWRSDMGAGLANLSSDLAKTMQDSEKALELVTQERQLMQEFVDGREQTWHKQEEHLQQKLREQEEALQKTIEVVRMLEKAGGRATLLLLEFLSDVASGCGGSGAWRDIIWERDRGASMATSRGHAH